MTEAPQERSANVVLTADVDPYARSMQQASQQTTTLTDQVNKLAASLDNLAKNAGRKLQIFGATGAAGIAATTAAYASFEKQMELLQAQAAITNRSFQDMENNVNRLRRSFPITTRDAADLVKTLEGMRDGTEQVAKLSDTFIRLGKATGEGTGALTVGLLQLQRQMGTTQRDTAKYANVLTDLSVRNGVAAQGILDFSSAIAPIGRIAGMTQTEIMGVSTAFSKAGQDGYYAANAFNKMLSDIMQSVQSGSPDLAKYSNLIGLTVDQFKQMGKTEAITRVFDELNRMGPNAIQVLNRMGLDGQRTLRAISGVTQQTGGIGKQVAEATAAFGDTSQNNALGRGSQAAMGGLSDSMQRLGNTTKEFAEAIGQNFAPAVKLFVDGMTSMVSVAQKLASGPLGAITAAITALGTVAGGVGGTLLKFAGPLATAAGAYALLRNPLTGGFREARTGTPGPYNAASAEGRMGAIRQGLFNAGTFAGGLYGSGQRALGLGQGTGPSFMSRVAGAPAFLAGQGMNLIAQGYQPLMHPFDPSNRDQFFGPGAFGRFAQVSATQGGAAGLFGRGAQGVSSGLSSIREGLGSPFQGFGAGLRTAAGGLGTFTAGLARASAGLGVLVTRTGLGMAGGLAAQAGRGIMNFMGGPLGVGLAAAGAGYYGMKAFQSGTSLQGVVGAGAENQTSFMDSYRSSVGQATTAMYDFTKAMKDATAVATPGTAAAALKVRPEDVGLANARDFTNTAVRDLGEQGITNLISSALTGKESPQVIQDLKLDLLKKYQDVDKVNQILETASQNKGQFNFGAFTQELAGMSGGNFRPPKEAAKYYEALSNELRNRSARAGAAGGTEAFQVQTRADFNALIAAAGGNQGQLNAAEAEQQQQFFKQQFLGGKGGRGTFAGVANGGGGPETFRNIYQSLLEQEGENAKAVDELFGRMGLTRDDVQAILKGGTRNGLDFSKLIQTSGGENLAEIEARVKTGPEMTAERIRSTRAGGATMDLAAVQAAIAPEGTGDVNKQIQAVDAMVEKLNKMGLTTGQVQEELINLKAAIGDTTDPLYQLATAAQQSAKDLANFKMAISGAGAGTQFQQQAGVFQGVMGAATGPEGEQERKQALADIRQQALQGAAFFKQQLIAQREFTISRNQAEEDFQTARARGERDFGIQQSRQADDYYRQLNRGQEDYDRSRRRSEADFQLSRTRQVADYNVSRARSDYDFNISRQRSVDAFNLSLKDSYADYVTSKLRSEQDFNHQVELMVEQSAKQMMNIYERITVQRTMSAQSLLLNANDQLQRMQEQSQNLDKLRGMGVSSDVIKQLGLTDANNAQQLARMVAELAENPELVAQFNKAVKDRLAATGSLVKDADSTAWEEMNRQYQLALQRGEEDFNKSRARSIRNFRISLQQQSQDYRTALQRGATDLSTAMKRAQADFSTAMKRGQEDYALTIKRSGEDYRLAITRQESDYNRSISDMVTDFGKQMKRGQEQFNRMAADLTMSMEEVLTQATKKLSGNLGKEAKIMLDTWNKIKKDVLTVSGQLKTAIDQQWGFTGRSKTNPGDLEGGINANKPKGGGSGSYAAPENPTTPITGGKVTTPFGKKGSMWASGYHTGDDYATPTGTPIHAARSGVVTSTGWGGAYGNLTKVSLGPGLETWYAHQSKFGVKPGQHVTQGQVIGYTGATGNVTGPHLHFEVRVNGSPVDPSRLGTYAASMSADARLQRYGFENLIKQDPNWSKWFPDGALSQYLNDKYGSLMALIASSGGDPGHAPTNVSGNKKTVLDAAKRYGWASMWPALYELVMHESGFKNTAQNPTSTAYGMFQFLNSTWRTVGGHKTSDPALQAEYGMRYIKQSYGNPDNAWRFWQGHHWYGDGAVFSGAQVIGVGERGPEAVLPLNFKGVEFLASLMQKMMPDSKKINLTGTATPVSHRSYNTSIDNRTEIKGPITVMANDPNELAEKMRLKRRRTALAKPALGGARA